jgi:sugar phosphate isomerase/epimerase
MRSRRSFIKKTALASAAISSSAVFPNTSLLSNSSLASVPKISLAQWSLHRAFKNGSLKAEDFASIARNSFALDAVEYVNQFYVKNAINEVYWNQLRNRANNEGVKSLLIMVDDEGLLGDPNSVSRNKAVENHYKWIHAAKILGCHSIRVNAFGEGSETTLKASLVNGLGALAAYGAKEKINVLIENHGHHTSNAGFMVNIIKEVNNPYLGTLPDFGNWCLNKEWGSTHNNECEKMYHPSKGVSEFLPFAKGVSAKTYEFNEAGYDTVIDYPSLLKLVKDFGYKGYIGIEYEGENLSEEAGIMATKKLINTAWACLD